MNNSEITPEEARAFCDAVETLRGGWIFGDKDSQIDWRKARQTIAEHLPAVRALLTAPAPDVEAFISEHKRRAMWEGSGADMMFVHDVRDLVARLKAQAGADVDFDIGEWAAQHTRPVRAEGDPCVTEVIVSIEDLHALAVRRLLEPAADVEAFIAEHGHPFPASAHPEADSVQLLYDDDVRALAASLRAERGWIPVTEREPQENGWHLAVVNEGSLIVKTFFNADGDEPGDRWITRGIVTHWQPLPPLPTEEKREGV